MNVGELRSFLEGRPKDEQILIALDGSIYRTLDVEDTIDYNRSNVGNGETFIVADEGWSEE